MALTRQMIEITFANAIAQAKEIDECAQEMLRVANSGLGGIKSELGSAWQGDSADAYLRKVDVSASNITKTAQRLQDVAQTLRSVAEIFRDTELKAIEIAEQRTY